MKLCYKLWLDNNGKAFGEGPYRLLLGIEKHGSLNKAAEELQMSYNKAWKVINNAEKLLGIKLLEREIGGSAGGGSKLTGEARKLLTSYGSFREEAARLLSALFVKHFSAFLESND